MPLIYESSVFKLTYDVLKGFHVLRRSFSKGERYSLGESIERALLEILLRIIEAGQTKQEWRVAALTRALECLENAKILIRLANDLEQIQQKQYLNLEESLNKIGRMLGGWRRSA